MAKPHDPNTKLFTWAHANSRSKTNSLKAIIIEHESTIRKHDIESCVISHFMWHKHDILSLRLLDINQTYCHTQKDNAIEGEKPSVYSLCILLRTPDQSNEWYLRPFFTWGASVSYKISYSILHCLSVLHCLFLSTWISFIMWLSFKHIWGTRMALLSCIVVSILYYRSSSNSYISIVNLISFPSDFAPYFP